MLLSQGEARFPLVPTLRATLGVKGHRPRVGTWDNKDRVDCFAALDLVGGRLTTRLLDGPARAKAVTGRSKVRRLPAAFAAHLRDVARAYPAGRARHPRVVLVIDNAPWHRGAPIGQVLAEQPHPALYRLPSYSPHLSVVERLGRVLRRRATHNRLFAPMAALRRALRASLCYYQTLRHKVRSLIRAPRNVAQSAAARISCRGLDQ
ncbi:MAG TPA: transposase [Geminicoccaceae bacterium]|nr:transposase [Geminicoccaceae bacterium]